MKLKVIRAITGEAIVVDADDYLWLSQHRWSISRGRYANAYAITSIDKRSISMHRLLMDPPIELVVDHIDGCGLNNSKDNLRVVTHKENANNVVGRADDGHRSSTEYIGVSLLRSGRYRAYLNKSGTQIHIGSFLDAKEAAIARDQVALSEYGERALLNFNGEDRVTPVELYEKKRELRMIRASKSSGLTGVHKQMHGRGFSAKISFANGKHFLGTFATAKEAGLAYDSVALYFGQRRETLNFPDEPTQPKGPLEVRPGMPAKTATGYLGVWKKYNRYVARIVRDKQLYRLGSFDTAEEAARAYDAKALDLGDTINLNFPKREVVPAGVLVKAA